MPRVRYGPRTPDELDGARAARARIPDIWSTGVIAVWETDPDALAQVLPPPLKPAARPLVRATISSVDLPGGHLLGAGSVAVRAVHDGLEGDYPLVMPMTTERALIGGREVFGEPKKLGDVVVRRDGDHVSAGLTRHGISFVLVSGEVTGELPPPPDHENLDFYFKFLPAPDGDGLDSDAALVHCVRRGRTRSLHRVEGTVVLNESPFDPVADLPVRELVEITLGERTSVQEGRIVERVPAESLLPYVHQRYDDPMQALDA
ncbi:acetoacetate decarboxylase family protein [Actinomadura barringtoniae]|uniref:Acetoacetate decarboxylase family protein n=1 Tax=Actinomadura barringtoniae TaxID=1427535 RepID=A0A939PC24_9ACTN|nr:acetoacetate decarboxylase family protein [Actinomadura barringtoniae]MBO2447318.1 acetoacetate decarboxylase family protein [Actinomadura barringtoniae]